MSRFLTAARLLTLFLALATAGTVRATIFDEDDRVGLTPTAGLPLARIGHLTNLRTGGRGTAVLVGRCHILTNFHVAYAGDKPANLTEPSRFQLLNEEPVRATPVIQGRLDLGATGANDQDWALLKLDRCLGGKYGWFALAETDLATATIWPVAMAGFPGDKPLGQLTLDPLCRIRPEILKKAGGWRHDCANRPGNSGSPLLVADEKDFVIVALNVSEMGSFPEIVKPYHVMFSNGAVPVSSFIGPVHKALKEAGETVREPKIPQRP